MITKEDILSGERFQQLCDVYCGDMSNLTRNPKIVAEPHKHMNLETLNSLWSNPKLVFCYSCNLSLFRVKLQYFQNPFVLVSHNEDTNVTEDYKAIADHPLIVKWFAQNVLMEHPKMESIPIGVANEMWTHGNLDTLLRVMESNIPKRADRGIFLNFRLHTHPGRHPCRDILIRKGIQWIHDQSHEDYLRTLATYKYAISPPGNGVDCHRMWECFYLGVVPILLRSFFTETIAKIFPCILVDSWEEVGDDLIKRYEEQSFERNAYQQRLKMSFYAEKIQTAVESIQTQEKQAPMHVAYAFVGPLPAYSIDTIHQLRLFYNGPVYYILSDTENPMVSVLRDTYGVSIVPYEEVKDNYFNELIKQKYNRFCIVDSLKGREKLFIYAFERFYLVHNLMKQRQLKNIFFMEVDNLVYDDPHIWLNGFTANDMSYMYDNRDRGASGICFLQSTDTLELFLDYCSKFIEFSDEFLDEMTALYRFWNANKSRVGMLPIHWPDDSIPYMASDNFALYKNSIFDAASMGIFIGGMDPHHTGGVIKKGLKGRWSHLDYTKYKYKWEKDEKGRNIPYVLGPGDGWLRINNLHIHSKVLKPCTSDADPPATI